MNSKGAKMENNNKRNGGKRKYRERQPQSERSVVHLYNATVHTKGPSASGVGANTNTSRHKNPHICTLVPTDVPEPGLTQPVLHPRKDVFVLKVAKVGPNGDRKCKMELELVTPKYNDQPPVYRVDTRETQCEPECPCCCGRPARRKKRL